jgi:hypothetical protein
VTSSLMRILGCLSWIRLLFCQAYISHIKHVIGKSSFCTACKFSVSTGFTEKIMPILHIYCNNGSLVTWTHKLYYRRVYVSYIICA